jgi:hypothetical protein
MAKTDASRMLWGVSAFLTLCDMGPYYLVL